MAEPTPALLTRPGGSDRCLSGCRTEGPVRGGRSFFGDLPAEPPETWGETILAVCRVPVEECGEPLVDPRALHAAITLADRHPWTRFRRTPWVRASVGQMLA